MLLLLKVSLKTNTFNTDEGSLTGESVTVSKTTDTIADSTASISSKTNMVFAGTMVTNGGCYAVRHFGFLMYTPAFIKCYLWIFQVVVGTGSNSEIGKISKGVQLAKQESTKTPLTLKLDEFGDQLTKIVGFICLLVWGVCIPKFSSDAFGGSWARGALYHAKIGLTFSGRKRYMSLFVTRMCSGGLGSGCDSGGPSCCYHSVSFSGIECCVIM